MCVCAVYSLLSTVCCLQFAVYSLLCAVYCSTLLWCFHHSYFFFFAAFLLAGLAADFDAVFLSPNAASQFFW